jgi:hypothetical protein
MDRAVLSHVKALNEQFMNMIKLVMPYCRSDLVILSHPFVVKALLH